jgi:MYXO-CTERM domain-containing protein
MRKALVLLLAVLTLTFGSTSAAFAADSLALDRVAQEEVQEEDDDGDRGLWGLLGLLGLGGLAGLMRRDRERDRVRGDYTDTGASTRTRNNP